MILPRPNLSSMLFRLDQDFDFIILHAKNAKYIVQRSRSMVRAIPVTIENPIAILSQNSLNNFWWNSSASQTIVIKVQHSDTLQSGDTPMWYLPGSEWKQENTTSLVSVIKQLCFYRNRKLSMHSENTAMHVYCNSPGSEPRCHRWHQKVPGGTCRAECTSCVQNQGCSKVTRCTE